jgi:HlyD family secretion protein
MAKKIQNSKRNRRILIAVIALIVIVLVVGKKAGWIGAEELTKVSVQDVRIRDITEYVSASGKIQPEKEIIIAPDASGEIVGLFVKEGDSVKKGDLLLKINPDIYQSTVEKVSASLNSTKANLANAKARKAQVEAQLLKAEADFKRSKGLFEQKVISQADFDAAKSSYAVAKAELTAAKESVAAAEFSVKNAEAALKEAQDNLTKTAVFAPIDGTISKLSKELGERVAGASQFSGGTEVMRIANLNNMEAQVDVSENDIVRVKLGDTALIEVDAYLDRKFKGVVTQIANSSNADLQNTDQVTNFKVKIRILQSSYKDLIKNNISPFRPGMSASVDIITNSKKGVISVPIQAVTTRADTSAHGARWKKNKKPDDDEKDDIKKEESEYVFVLENGKAVLRKVTTGIQDDNYFEITSGLKEGEKVIYAPYSAVSRKLKNREKVKVVDKDKLFSKN